MKKITAILGIFIIVSNSLSSEGWYLNIKGDIKIAGYFNVHMDGNSKQHSWVRCGAIDPQYGIMYLEAMLFAMDQINKNTSFLYGLTLGARIQDTCGDREHQRNSMYQGLNAGILGVIGPRYSDAAKTASTVFELIWKPVISYSAAGHELGNRKIYPLFYRTVPSDREVAKLLVNLAMQFNWTYVAVISSAGNYDQRMSSSFRQYAKSHGICTPVDVKLSEDAKQEDFKSAMESIMKQKSITVVFLFLKDHHLVNLLEYTENTKEKYKRLTIVFGDGLGIRVKVMKGKSLVNGSLTIQVDQNEVPEFREYFLKLTPENNGRNSFWFEEFWKSEFNCSAGIYTKSPRKCSGKEAITEGHGYYKETPVLTVINAVYAYAHAFRKVIEKECISKNKTAKFCFWREDLLQGQTNSWQILREVRNVRFKEPYRDRVFHFDKRGGYTEDFKILNWIMDKDENTVSISKVGKSYGLSENKTLIYSNITIQSSLDDRRLSMNTTAIKWKTGGLPVSVCSKPCQLGQVTKYQSTNNRCCWKCGSCSGNDIGRNETCLPCTIDYVPDAARLICMKLPVRYPGLQTSIVTAVSCSACIGVLCTIFVIGLFLKNFNKRVVKESGRELCLNMLVGIAATYLTPVVFILKPSTAVCSVQRLALSFSLTMSYAPLLLRTNRIYRIFKSAKTSVQRPAMVRPKSQLLLSLALTALSLLIGIVSITGSSIKISTAYPKHREYTLKFCELSSNVVFMNLSYSTTLMIITTWFAFKTRNFPRNYNEAKYIGFTMYTTCLVLAVFLPVFYLLDDDSGKSRMVIMCCICFLIATINLFGLFGQRLSVLLCSHVRPTNSDISTNSTVVPSISTGLRDVSSTSSIFALKDENSK